jgi:hypothetical protein
VTTEFGGVDDGPGSGPQPEVNHRLTIRWRGEPVAEAEIDTIVDDLRVAAGGRWVGHVYDQCDENWEPVWSDESEA